MTDDTPEASRLKEIYDAMDAVREAQEFHEECKLGTKAAKEAVEKAVDRLMELRKSADERLPLFDQHQDDDDVTPARERLRGKGGGA